MNVTFPNMTLHREHENAQDVKYMREEVCHIPLLWRATLTRSLLLHFYFHFLLILSHQEKLWPEIHLSAD